MESSGVPNSQGVVIKDATTAKKRGDRSMGHPNGYVGKGTPGSRLKSAHRKWKPTKPEHRGLGLRKFAKLVAADDSDALQEDAQTWLESKAS